MNRYRAYVEELTRALLVLALVLLNVAYTPRPAVAHDGFAFTPAAAVFCDGSGESDRSAHAPCHACRSGSDALLPPPPGDPVSIQRYAAAVSYLPVDAVSQDDFQWIANRSRGPPLHA